ncbi:hypothetical protein V8C35DRAFT_276801 [Trichoderma chlorosporum]
MSTISEAIIKDHRELEQYYNEVVNNAGNHDYRDRYGNQFKYLGDKGKEMAESDRKDHAVVKEMLKPFQKNMKASDPDYIEQLQKLWGPLSEHIKEEEERDLAALEEKLQAVEGHHPSAGEHPPFETAMGLLAAPIDHVADLFRKFPDNTISPNPSTK